MHTNLKSLLPFICIIFLISCGGGGGGGSSPAATYGQETAPSDDGVVEEESSGEEEPTADDDNAPEFALTSENYNDGTAIPLTHACTALGGSNASPQFSWTNSPADTAKYALIMDDETSPCGTGSLACVHWALFNIPASNTSLVSDVDTSTIDGSVEGNTYIPTTDYEGPCPPSAHIYKTTVYALDSSMVAISANASFTRSTFESEYADNILDQAEITGTFTPEAPPTEETIEVTVAANSNGAGNVYVINGEQKASLTLDAGTRYTFTHPTGHPLKFSTTADGTHGGGSEYTAGVDTSASGETVIEQTADTPLTLYYYCSIHAGMGGVVTFAD